jgi:hypothetical protein
VELRRVEFARLRHRLIRDWLHSCRIDARRLIEDRRGFLHETRRIGRAGIRDKNIATAQACSGDRKPGKKRYTAQEIHETTLIAIGETIFICREDGICGWRETGVSAE